MKDFLRYTVIGGVFLMPFIPLYVNDSLLFPYITGKTFLFRTLVEIMFASWVLLMWRDSTYRPKFSWLIGALTVFMVCIGISTLFGVDPLRSFWGTIERAEGYITLLHLYAYVLIVCSVLTTSLAWNTFWKVSLWVSVLVCITALRPPTELLERLEGTFGNPIFLAGYLLIHIFIGLLFALNSQEKKESRYVYAAIVFLNLVFLYFTATRGALLALVGGLTITTVCILLFERKNTLATRLSAGLLVSLVLLVGGFFAIKNTSVVTHSLTLERLSTISLDTIKEQGRYYAWLTAIDGFKERPLIGWGPENYRKVYSTYYRPELTFDAPWFDRVHNTLLEWLVAGGVVGLAAYLSIFATALLLIWRRTQNHFSILERSIISGLLTAYFIHSFFVFDTITTYILTFSIFAYIHARGTLSTKTARSVKPKNLQGIKALIVYSFTIVLLLITIYEIIVRPFFAARYALASTGIVIENPSRSREFFERIDPNYVYRYEDMYIQVLRHVLGYIHEGSVTGSERAAWVTLSEQVIRRLLETSPDDPELHYYLGMFLREAGNIEESNVQLERALMLSPNRQIFMLEIVVNKLKVGAYEEAFNISKQTHALNQSYARARLTFAAAALYRNEIELAREILMPLETWALDDPLLISAITATGHTEFLIPIYERRAYLDPDNFQLLTSLAVVHFDAGNTARAIEFVEKAIQINPLFEKQGLEFIRDIQDGRRPQ